MLNFKWVDHPQHPGSYLFDYSIPIHDGHYRGKLFDKLEPIEKEWDEYEDYLMSWANKVTSAVPVRGHRDVHLATWEMFVFCYDGWFRRQSHEAKECLFRSLDNDLQPGEQYAGYQDTLSYLSTHHPGVLKAWKYEFLSQIHPYADWLANLVDTNAMRTKS